MNWLICQERPVFSRWMYKALRVLVCALCFFFALFSVYLLHVYIYIYSAENSELTSLGRAQYVASVTGLQ